MERHQIKVIGWHLLALFAYSVFNLSSAFGSLLQAFCLFFHVLVCITFGIDEGLKTREAHWLSLFLVLVIGVGVCSQMYFPH